jgi:hypothetical protein
MKQFKIRCSAIGQIMTNPRSKSEMISETAKTYCETWLKEQIFDRKKEISTKYMTKGIEAEDKSIDFLIENNVLPFCVKNEKFFENEFMQGTPDIDLLEEVVDIKNSWDVFTFPYFETKINKMYWWQLQGYIILTGKDRARLIYTLMDAPEHLIEKEIFYKTKDYEFLDSIEHEKIVQKVRKNMTFGDLPPKLRYKIFDVEKDQDAKKQIAERVYICRNYIYSLI